MSNSFSNLLSGTTAPSLHSDCDKPFVSDFLIMKEEWRVIENTDSKYEVSNLGRIRSFAGVGRSPKRTVEPKILALCKDGRGYYNFTIRRNGKAMVIPIHIAVAMAFLTNTEGFRVVRHLNDDKADNRLENIAWGTHADNRNDGIINCKHFHKKGVRAAQAKLTPKLVKAAYKSTKNNCELGRKYGVTEGTISKIKLGRTWNHITGLPRIK